MRSPVAPRQAGDARGPRHVLRALKAEGVVAVDLGTRHGTTTRAAVLPRVREAPPTPGFCRPATRADVVQVLRVLGEPCTYGVRAVELTRLAQAPAAGVLVLGTYLVPGQIRLYEMPEPPWLLPGRLPDSRQHTLVESGAEVTYLPEVDQTVIAWPGTTLRDFVLLHGLVHEIAHHVIQQYTGKRKARVRRSRDHEAFAERFVARHRDVVLAALAADR